MSNYVFPSFQGWSWEKTITPVWNTQTYESESGRETRIQKWKYPRYKISLTYNFLTDNTSKWQLDKGDIERLQGFFNAVGGSFDDFLYFDDTENSVENQTFGLGNGQQTVFQLVRNHPYWAEPVNGIVEIPQIFIDGVLTTEVSVDPYGVVTFDSPPPADSVLTWTGNYYFRVRFDNDEIELTRTWDGVWESIEISMKKVKA